MSDHIDEETPEVAFVASPKLPTKKAAQNAAISERARGIVNAAQSSASKLKNPYNFRTRSLARFFVSKLEDEADRRQARALLKELRSFADMREVCSSLVGEEPFEEVVIAWFDAGTEKDKP